MPMTGCRRTAWGATARRNGLPSTKAATAAAASAPVLPGPQAAVDRREDPAPHGQQVGRERDLAGVMPGEREGALDLGRVLVLEDAVGVKVAVDLREREVLGGLLAGARRAALGVDDEPGRLDDAAAQERERGQRGRRREAARVRDEARLADGARRARLGHGVARVAQQLGARVREAVPARVEVSREPERARDVDDAAARPRARAARA